jgi:broad specificity phosphatase PhoE
MSLQITYFVHGTTTDNENGIATGWNPGELSELGIKQSKELGETVKDSHFDAVFCSDLKRAVDSAKLAFKSHKVVRDERLREINYGDYNGHEESFKDNLKDYFNQPFPNGESYKDVENRIRNFMDFLKENYNNKHIAIVAHQAPQLALEVIANNKTWEQAIDQDWRKTGNWQPGWGYRIH